MDFKEGIWKNIILTRWNNFSLGIWNFYFLAKLYLYFSGVIRFDLFANLLFAAFLLTQIPQHLKFRPYLNAVKLIAGIFIALALLWRDSWLPPPVAAYELLMAHGIPTKEYIASFILRYFANLQMLIIVATLLVCISVRHWKFLTPITLLLVFLSPAFSLVDTNADEVEEEPLFEEEIITTVRPLASLKPTERQEQTKKSNLSRHSKLPSVSSEELELSALLKEASKPAAKIKKEKEPPPELTERIEPKEDPLNPTKATSPYAWKPIREKDPQRYAEAFFEAEAFRKVPFNKPDKKERKFDIVLFHICSLSWDDLKATSIDWKPFFKQFQLLFTNFNAVTSYSGPSVQRLLKSNCGQQRHSDLYKNAPDDCFLFKNLANIGYKPYYAANHEGIYGNFARNIKKYGELEAPLVSPVKLPVHQNLFDGSLVYDDYASLENWWKKRLQSKEDRAAVYFNTATLHDGSHWYPKVKNWWKRPRITRYNEFLDKLLKDVTKSFDLLEKSGRNVVFIFIPEHGMALKGTKIQVAGLRDIPLPQINLIPVGIKFFGKGFNNKTVRQKIISKPTSYMALTSALAAMFDKSPFGPKQFDLDYLAENIVQTDHVNENQGALVVKPGKNYMIFDKKKKWSKLPVK